MQVIGDVPVFGDPVDAEALQQIQRCPCRRPTPRR
jgi:hypothetical protein